VIITTTDDFRSTKTFAADSSAVFSALSDVDALTGGWAPAWGSAEAANTLRFLMGNKEVVIRADEADRSSCVRWSVLVCEPTPDWVGATIAVDLSASSTGAELRFHHHGLNPGRVLRDVPRRVDPQPRQPRRLRRLHRPCVRSAEPGGRPGAARQVAAVLRLPLTTLDDDGRAPV